MSCITSTYRMIHCISLYTSPTWGAIYRWWLKSKFLNCTQLTGILTHWLFHCLILLSLGFALEKKKNCKQRSKVNLITGLVPIVHTIKNDSWKNLNIRKQRVPPKEMKGLLHENQTKIPPFTYVLTTSIKIANEKDLRTQGHSLRVLKWHKNKSFVEPMYSHIPIISSKMKLLYIEQIFFYINKFLFLFL